MNMAGMIQEGLGKQVWEELVERLGIEMSGRIEA